MFKIQTLNKISAQGLAQLPLDDYETASEILNPDAILLRSADMHSMEVPESVKAIARAGAGTNNIPIPAEYSTVISTVATLGVCLYGSLKYIVEAFNKMKKILAIKDENNIIEAARANALKSNRAGEGEK